MKTTLLPLILALPLTMAGQNREVSPSPRSGSTLDGFHVYELGQSGVDLTVLEMIVGGCVQITNFQSHGPQYAFGAFVDSVNATGLENGLVITSGKAENAIGPDNMNDESYNQNGSGNPDLDLMLNGNFYSYDATWIEFDFTPLADTIFATEFVFGSEEYPEYVNSAFNDVFGFFISGPGIDGPYTNGAENIAYVPGTNLPIAINNVNNGYSPNEPSVGPCENCDYFVDNSNGPYVQYDAMTSAIGLEYPVIAGETYHFTIAVADVGDHVYDSGVFLESESFCGKTWFQRPMFTAHPLEAATFQFENQSEKAETYFWEFGDGETSFESDPSHTYISPGTYDVTLTCSNACFDTSMTITLDVGMVTDIAEAIEIDASLRNVSSEMLELNGTLGTATGVSFEIIDLLGKTHRMEHIGIAKLFTERIDVSRFPSGSYILNLVTQNSRKSMRFVKM